MVSKTIVGSSILSSPAKVLVFCSLFRGSLSEWFNVRVLKTLEPKGSVGSNPTASAKKLKIMLTFMCGFVFGVCLSGAIMILAIMAIDGE